MSDASGPPDWRSRLHSVGGFFRGVPFFYDSVEGEIGRRTVLKEFPGRDKPFSEDLGLRTRRFTIEMFVIGPDYDVARDDLRQALETAGPGQLLHPYWGNMQVTVEGPVRVRETPKNGGMARFTVTFVEAGATLSQAVAPSPQLEVVAAADLVVSVEESQFAALYAVVGEISAVADAAEAALNEVAHQLNRIRGKINTVLQVINDTQAAINDIVATATDIINTPQKLASALTGLYASVVGGIGSITSALRNLQDFFGGEDALPSVGSALSTSTRINLLNNVMVDFATAGDALPERSDATPTESRIAENQRQLIRLAKISAVANGCKVAAGLKFDNHDQTTAVRQALTALLDGIIAEPTLPDELYGTLSDLRATVVRFLDQAADTLPELKDLTLKEAAPALVVAYQLYGDSRRDAEILIRNPTLRDPTSIPGGQPIKVLSDV